MTSSPDKDLELQLQEAGNKLQNPPLSAEELLQLLENVESCLSRVEQSPKESMQSALSPSVKALVAENLFNHADCDVKVAIASCISEITRITAPDAPYSDEKMKDVFKLIVSTFEDLADQTSKSYSRRTTILETVANVRSCVVMLDLECDDLIVQMFQHFLKSIRDNHPENIFSSMETVMTLVLEESEEISGDFLYPLLSSLRIDKEVLPVARKLAEKVIENCASKINPFLSKAVKSLKFPAQQFGTLVASMCSVEETGIMANDNDEGDKDKEIATVATTDQLSNSTSKDKTKDVDVGKNEENVHSTSGNNNASKDAFADTSEEKSTHSKSASKDYSKDVILATSEEKSLQSKSSLKHDGDKKDQGRTAEAQVFPESRKTSKGDSSSDVKCVPESSDNYKGKRSNSSKKHTGPSVSNNVESENIGKHNSEMKNSSKSRDKDQLGDFAASSKKKKSSDSGVSTKKGAGNNSSKKDLTGGSGQRKIGRPKRKEGSKPNSTSADKLSDEGDEPEAKPQKIIGKKRPMSPSIRKDSAKKEKNMVSKSVDKKVKQSTKKTESIGANGETSKFNQDDDKKRGNHAKVDSESESNESSFVSKAETKPAKDMQSDKETLKTSRKRERTKDSPKVYGSEVVGLKVKVWWPRDRQFYEGKIESFNSEKRKHKVVYTDGDVEHLNLKTQRFEFVGGGPESGEDGASDDDEDHAAVSEIRSKKQKTSHVKPIKPEKADTLQKQKAAAASVSKHKGEKNKSKEGDKSEETKARKKANDDSEEKGKNKDRTPKTVIKSGGASKTTSKKAVKLKVSKSKKEKTKGGKGKVESPLSSLSLKGKSNAKEDDEDEVDDSPSESESVENDDRAIITMSKAEGTEKKSTKKRVRE